MDGLHRLVLGFGSCMRIPIEMGTKDAVDLITGQPKKKKHCHSVKVSSPFDCWCIVG